MAVVVGAVVLAVLVDIDVHVDDAVAVDGEEGGIVGEGEDAAAEALGLHPESVGPAVATRCPCVAGGQFVLAVPPVFSDEEVGLERLGIDAIREVAQGDEIACVPAIVEMELDGLFLHCLALSVGKGCVASYAGVEGFGIGFADDPETVVAVHPDELEGRVLCAWDIVGAHVAFGGIPRDVLAGEDGGAVVAEGVFLDLVDIVDGHGAVDLGGVGWIDGHSCRIAEFGGGIVVEPSATLGDEESSPGAAVEGGIVVLVVHLVLRDAGEADGWRLFLVELQAPYPVAAVGHTVNYRDGIILEIIIGPLYLEGSIVDDAEVVALDVLKATRADVEDVEIEPVGVLVVGMSRCVGDVDFVASVAGILGIGACGCALDELHGSPGERDVVVLVGERHLGDGRVPAHTSPAHVDVVGVLAEDEGIGIGGVVLYFQPFLLAQRGDVAGASRDAVIEALLVAVAAVDDHDALVGQDEEGGIVVVVGLEIAAHEHFLREACLPVNLAGLDVAVPVDIADEGDADGLVLALEMEGTGVGKPAPGAFVGKGMAIERTLGGMLSHRLLQREQTKTEHEEESLYHRFVAYGKHKKRYLLAKVQKY